MRTGVASQLYRRIEEAAVDSGQTRLFSNAIELAKPFFEKHGWTLCRTLQVERRGVKMTNNRMEKLLA
jgi:putative acetyltransferase